MSTDDAKRAAAEAALAFVTDGATLALGSGSTAAHFVRALGAAGRPVRCTATSRATAALAASFGLTVLDPNDVDAIDLCVDGADEIDAKLRMMKGGGACLLWEKILGRTAAQMVAICDDGKLVDTLGRFPLAIEIVPFAWRHTAAAAAELLRAHGIRPGPVERRMAGSAALVTDSGNHIFDVVCGAIPDPVALEAALNTVPGVVENGLFSHVADVCIIGRADGSVTHLRR